VGLLLAVVVHPANIQDRDGARLVIDKLIGRFPRLRLIWADAGYSGQLVDWVMSMSGWVLEIVKRPRASHHFEVLPRRWVFERTLAWLGGCRRLSKDYEAIVRSFWHDFAPLPAVCHESHAWAKEAGLASRP
jgi:putative transposase